MTIKINTRQTASQQELPLEAFGANQLSNPALEASANLTGTIVKSLDNVYTTLQTRKKEADRLAKAAQKEFDAKAKAADITLLNNAEHLANDEINILEAEYQQAIKLGTVDEPVTMQDGTELPSIRERWAAANPRGGNYKLRVNGNLNDPSRQGAYIDNIASSYTTKTLSLATKENTRVIVNQVLDASDNVSQTIYETIQTAPFSMIDEAGTQKVLGSIIAFGEMSEKGALSKDGVIKHNAQAQAYTEKYFLHQIDNAVSEQDVTQLLTMYEKMDADFEWISPTDTTVRTAAKRAIANMRTIGYEKNKSAVQAPYEQSTVFTNSLLSLSPTDVIDQEELLFHKDQIEKLLVLNEKAPKNESGKSILTDDQVSQLTAASAYLSLFATNEVVPTTEDSTDPGNFEKFSIADHDVFIELQKKVFDPNYVLSEDIHPALRQFSSHANRYVSSRKEKVNYLYNGLIKNKDRRVLNSITTDIEEQDEMIRALGMNPRNIPYLSDKPVNTNEPDSVAAYIVDTMNKNSGNIGAVGILGYQMAAAEGASDEEVLLGNLLMMSASDDTMNVAATTNMIKSYMNKINLANKYATIVPKSVRDRVEALDVMPHFKEQKDYDNRLGKNGNIWQKLRQGIIAEAWIEYSSDPERVEKLFKKLEKKQRKNPYQEKPDKWFGLVDGGYVYNENGEPVPTKLSDVDAPKFDNWLRDHIANNTNDLFDRIGYRTTVTDYNTRVYIPPVIYRTFVQRDFDAMGEGAGLWLKKTMGNPIYNFATNMWKGEYQTELDDVAERTLEANVQAMVQDEVYDVREKLIPFVGQIARNSPNEKTARKADALIKDIQSASDDELVDILMEATVTSSKTGDEIPAFDFSVPSSKNGQHGIQVRLWNDATNSYEAVTYNIGTEEEPIVEDYIIPTQSVIDIINKEGIGMGFIMQSTRGTLKQAVKSSFNTVVGMGL